MKVMIVDDDKLVLKILVAMTSEGDYEVLEFPSGELAWDYLQTMDEPLIILLDWVMAGIDGIELCKKIKTSKWASQTHVIMLTAKSNVEDMITGFDAGADDFLIKPVDSRELNSRLSVGERILKYQYDLEQRNCQLEETTAVMEKILQELNAANEQLRQQAVIDSMTGVANRRGLTEFFTREWRVAKRTGQPITVLMVDVDFFKLFNDTYGHSVGDDCLKTVADILKESVNRGGDMVARFGGEEFVVVLLNTDSAGGAAVAAAIQNKLAKKAIPHVKSKVSDYITISLGVAGEIPQEDGDFQGLIERADQAMYEAKRQGRGRVVIADSQPIN
jgi:diguanylate cyclase (GGDEF)-like protein